ncbi:MAG: carboxypeptidase-like regulatory domain-containing protein [bacterium]
MSKYSFPGCIITAALLVLVAFGAAGAQESRGSLTGKVSDQNGDILPGATVVVKNVDTNVTSTGTTNEEGSYTFPLLQPGRYSLTVTATGFAPATREGIQISVSEKRTLDVPMQVTGVGEMVEVVSSSAPLETGSVSTGSVISSKQISELPLIDGSPYQLATLAPGITYTGNPAFTSPTSNGNLAAFRANGATGPNQVTLDGSPNFAIDGGVGFSPPSDAVTEFKVQTSTFDAQQGYAGGATVNVAVKSGTNDFHGSVYEFNRARNRTANYFFTNRAGQPKPNRTYNRFGGSLNGPVRIPRIYNGRNKTFFLFAYERLKNSEAEPQLFTVPTAAMRQGDFSALLNLPQPVRIYDPATAQATGTVTRTQIRDISRATTSNPLGLNIIPLSRLNPVAATYLKLYPLPNVAGNADGTLNYSSNMIRSSNYRSWITRVDHRISETQSVFGKYYHSFNPEDRYNWTGTPITQGIEFRTNDGASLDYTATLSNTMVLDIRGNFSRFVQQRQPAAAFDPAQLGFTAAALSVMRGYQYLPRFDVRTYDAGRPVRSILGSNRSDYNAGLRRPFYVASIQPTLTQIIGNHGLKYGYDLRGLRENLTTNGFQGGRFFFDGTYTSITTTTTTNSDTPTNLERNRNLYGRDVAAFLFGIPSASSSQSLIDTTSTNYSVQSIYHGFFVQDDWRLTPKLTLNLGLRYELEMGLTERYNRLLRGFDATTPSPIQAAALAAYTTAYNADPNRATNFPRTPDQFRVLGGATYADQNNRNLWNADKNTWQPRVGAAYQLHQKTVLRGGFGIFMSPYRIIQDDIQQTGFSASTPLTPTNNQGRTFVATLDNPFPSGLTPAFGSSLGILTSAGGTLGTSNGGLVPADRKNAKFSRIIIGVQRELPGQFVIEANFVTSWGYDMAVNRNLNFVPRQYLADLSTVTDNATATALDTAANNFLSGTITNPFLGLFNNTPNSTSGLNTGQTITRAQSLLAFPQFANVWVQEYNGTNRYNALQLQASKRFAKDLSLNLTYTRSKLREKLSYLNTSDPNLEDRVGTDDRPNRFTLAAVYQLPLGHGRRIGNNMNQVLDYVVGGWQVNGTYEWQTGHPILFGTPLFYAGDVTALTSHAGENDGQGRKYGIDVPAFDTTGLVRLSSFSLRNVPTTLDNLRHQAFQSVNLSLTKNFKLGEQKRLQIRGEALNAFNHPYFIDLSSDPNNASYARYTTQRNLPRDIQLGVKFTF